MSEQERAARGRRANEIRLNAIRQKVERNAVEKSQIKNSLITLDGENKSSTHIRFSDSDDSDSATIEGKKLKPKKRNFDDVLGFVDGDSSENEIEIKPQFQGKHGEKLLELQSGYGNDKRFKLDKRFAEEHSDNDEGIDIAFSVKKDTEVQQNLKLLNQVIGRNVTDDKSKKKSEKFIDVSSRRYDPFKGEHLEVKPEKKEIAPPKKKKKKKREEPAVPVTEVDPNRFYETSTTVLKDAFASKSDHKEVDTTAKQESEPFSFLAMLGRNNDNDEENINNDKPYEEMDVEDSRFRMNSSMKKDMPTLMSKFRYDSSDTEEEIEDTNEDEINENNFEELKESNISTENLKSNFQHPSTFFMTSPSDTRITEGIKLFCWNKSFEQVRNEWLEVKDTLIKDYKKKHRDAKRKEKKAKYESKLIASTTSET
uniref:nucleolar protein 8-like n=1 Tax=Styela clava TaxID=7725 RepID=UPI00193949A9|nr:nucleolar protein 8-like [Styela clava]